jgi:hypothetical protein
MIRKLSMNSTGVEVFGDSYGCNEELQGGVNNVPTRIIHLIFQEMMMLLKLSNYLMTRCHLQ